MNRTQFRFIHWITQRETSRTNYELLGVKGQCADPLIQKYRFCNVNREHDAVTLWVRDNVRTPIYDAPLHHALFNIAIARVINEPNSLKNFLPCMDFSKWPVTLQRLMRFAAEAEDKVLRGAYLIVSHGLAGKGIPAVEYYAGAFMEIALSDFSECQSMRDVARELSGILGFSDFLSNQVLTDLRYMRCTEGFEDRMDFVLCGPGTRRGINRWHSRDPDKGVPSRVGSQFILDLREDPEFCSHLSPEIRNHFQDPNNLSNCFCEWDKYERALDEIANGRKPSLRKI